MFINISLIVFPRIVSFLENFPPSCNSFHGNYSLYKVKNCHIENFPHLPLSKKNNFRRNYLRKYGISYFPIISLPIIAHTLVTQPMLQRQPNRKELRSMDSYIQILCRFQKCKRKVPPPSPLSNDFEKSFFFSKKLLMIFFQNWHFWTLDGIFEIKMMMKICLGVIRFGIEKI